MAVGSTISLLQNGVHAGIGHRHQLHRRRAGHHGLRQLHGRQLVRRQRGRRPTSFTVGGTVSGLSGTVVLQDNGGDDLSVTANGSFTFATTLATGRGLQRDGQDEPVRADLHGGQRVRARSGSANVTNVAVTCTTT